MYSCLIVSLGDFVFKRNDKKGPTEQIVTASPDVQIRDLTDDLEFMVIACDGIWDVLSNDEVIDFVRCRIAAKMDPSTICEELMTRCLAPDCQMGGLGCDNMTVIVVCYVNGKTYEELAARCAATPRHSISGKSSGRGAGSANGLNSEGASPSSSCSSSSSPDTPDDDHLQRFINEEEESEGVVSKEKVKAKVDPDQESGPALVLSASQELSA